MKSKLKLFLEFSNKCCKTKIKSIILLLSTDADNPAMNQSKLKANTEENGGNDWLKKWHVNFWPITSHINAKTKAIMKLLSTVILKTAL